MDELHKIAKTYYETANSDDKDLVHQVFKRMDMDGDGEISLQEFLAFVKSEGRIEMASPSFFKELNKNGTGRLDLMEAMTLWYIIESGRKFCDGCGEFMKGFFLSCMECFDHEDRSFNLCCACFEQGRYVHSHKKFLDNYVLLEIKRLDALKEKNAAKRKLRREAEKKRAEQERQKDAPTPDPEVIKQRLPEPVRHEIVPYNPHQGDFLHNAAVFAVRVAGAEVGPSRRRYLRSLSQIESPLCHFFKIVFPSTLKDKKLRIPREFVEKFGEGLSDIAKVAVPNGDEWQVGITKEHNNIWLDEGWQEFVEHHSIGSGYLVVFRYRGDSNFSVLIFDMTACEIQYRRVRPTGGEGINDAEKCSFYDEDEMKDEGSVESLDTHYCRALKSRIFNLNAREGGSSKGHGPSSETTVKKEYLEMTDVDDTSESRRGKPSKKRRMSGPHGETKANKSKSKSKLGENELLPECEAIEFVPRGFAKASEKSKRAIHAARMFEPKSPSFMVMLRRYNFYNRFLYVPLEFAQRHMSNAPRCIKLQVSDGREWPIQINRNQRRYLSISKGWNEFSQENNLKEGDLKAHYSRKWKQNLTRTASANSVL
ncbi:B3 domain-containing transcription factor VRN1-like [Populus alba x Populus x berolinensis]|nr:B3 domain-containing transcription factor VRN1-like [Populus alba x Populus x berolinensis]